MTGEKRRVNLWIGADLYAELEAEAAEIGVKVPALLKIAARAWCRPRHSGVSPTTLRRSVESSTSVARDTPECRPGVAGDTSPPSHSPPSRGRERAADFVVGRRSPLEGSPPEAERERETAPPDPTLVEKGEALSAWRKLGLRLDPRVGEDVDRLIAGLKAGKAKPIRPRACTRVGRAYAKHAPRWAAKPQPSQPSPPPHATGSTGAAGFDYPGSGQAEPGDGSLLAGHADYLRSQQERERAQLAEELRADPADFEAKREAARRALAALAANEHKPNPSKPQERGEEDPMESEPISAVEEAERPSGRAEPPEANTGSESQPQAAASREDGGAA